MDDQHNPTNLDLQQKVDSLIVQVEMLKDELIELKEIMEGERINDISIFSIN